MGSSSFAIKTNPQALFIKNNYLQSISKLANSGKPNIILLTVDDLGMADCSLYGEGTIETPNIDKLGSQGIIFDNAYVTSPVCAPSRASIITGRYNQRFGFEFTMHERYLKNRFEYLGFKYFFDSDPWLVKWASEVPNKKAINDQGLPLSEITLPEVLKKQGYRTGIVGKWHLGWSEKKLPSVYGFDEQYGFFTSHSHYAPEGSEGIVNQKIANDWTDPYIWSGQRKGAHAIYRNNKEIKEEGYLTDRITEEAMQFMDKKAEQPFFLWISFNAPHTPLQAKKEDVDRFMDIKDPVKRVYRAMIFNLDNAIGRIMNYLSENDLENNTLIFFISDNGGAEYTHTTENGNYGGGKNTEFEGGVKVPMILKWPGVLPAGKRFEPMVSAMDIYATSVAITNAPKMTEREIDGINLLPFLLDSIPSAPHKFLFWQRGISKAVRSNEYKLLMNDETGEKFLYDLKENKYENPEISVENQKIVESLVKAHEQWRRKNVKPMWPSVIYFSAIKDGKTYYFEQ